MRVLGLEPKTYGLKVCCPDRATNGSIASCGDAPVSVVPKVVPGTPENGCEWVTTTEARHADRRGETRIDDADLARLVEVWPTLPPHVRQTILTITDAAAGR